MRRIVLPLLSVALATLAACGDDATVDTTASTSETSTTDDSTSTSPGPTSETPTTGVPTTTDATTSTSTTDATSTTTDDTTTTTSTTDDTTATTTTTTDTTDTTATTDTTTAADNCGDGVIEDPEVCDGAALADQDCVSQGFDSGTLACAADCTAFDISGCMLASCGNGSIEGEESCDGDDLAGQDCVSQGFESGTLTCMENTCVFELGGCFTCGDGNISGTEVCDGTEVGGEDCVSQGFESGELGCAADCGALDTSNCSTCGDNALSGAEECDGALLGGATCKTQGADFGTLKCSADCGFDLSACITAVDETEPNDDGMVATSTNDFSSANANGPYTADTLIKAKITPVGDDDVFAVQNTGNGYATLRLETFSIEGPGTCTTIDTVIDIRTAANLQLATDDQSGINNCSLITNYPLAPGETVYVRVYDYLDNTVIDNYLLDIQLDPVICGDGALGPGEQCDDGNGANGDGCSDACKVEGATAEIEPNNTNAQADGTGIVSTGNSLFAGAITPVADVDRYRLDLAAASFLRLESFSALNDCTGINTVLRLFDSNNVSIIADTGNSGISTCSALVFPVPAGTSYIHLEENGNNAVINSYFLQTAVLSDAGAETEPNETLAAANVNLQNGSDLLVFGDHAVNTDSDYYRIDVPVAGSSLRLEVIEGDRTVETCESNGVDSRLTLYTAGGVEIANDDDSGRGFCSMIDGTGSAPLHTGAHNLAAGTYYVQVRASTFSQNGAAGQFIYRLAATVRKP
ncbi:DUF4215 domain-containing protein [Nannocystis pusilla]|uniref:DUF4215 domain-containing protein n=1 Tax=Nannocystis pusilla TaxID=889268 RepID=UPI003B769D21